MRKYRGNPDDNTMHMAVELAWSNTKDALKEYTSAYSIEDVISLYEKQLFAISGILPEGLLKKKRLRFQQILESNKEFQEFKSAISASKKDMVYNKKTSKQLSIIPEQKVSVSY